MQSWQDVAISDIVRPPTLLVSEVAEDMESFPANIAQLEIASG